MRSAASAESAVRLHGFEPGGAAAGERRASPVRRLVETARAPYDRARHALHERFAARFAILLRPIVIRNRFHRGVLWVMGNADCVAARFPDLRRYFLVISTSAGQRPWASGSIEDIHGLTLAAHAESFRAQFPGTPYLVMRNADFIDERDFYPEATEKDFDVLFNSSLIREKRHELILSTLYDLRDRCSRDVRAAVIDWIGAPRLTNSIVYPPLFYLGAAAILNRRRRRYARSIRRRYAAAVRDGLRIDLLPPVYRKDSGSIAALRRLYSRSKVHVLLSKNEGVNRATKESMLCNTPVLAIAGSVTATELVNDRTGVAAGDAQREISEGILHLLEHHRDYSPREWVLEHVPRSRAVETLWHAINELERHPGYPDIEAANAIRREFGASECDNHSDLNNWRGGGSAGSLGREMQIVRTAFSSFVQSGPSSASPTHG